MRNYDERAFLCAIYGVSCEKCNYLCFKLIIMQEEWGINLDYASKSRFKRIHRSHEREFISCFNNLNKIKDLLKKGAKLSELNYHPAFFRSEGKGLFRVGESGVKSAKALRLYVYPETKTKIIYILGIGTKETQQEDIAAAKDVIKNIS